MVFVGVDSTAVMGINYTNFYDRKSTAHGNAASGGPTKLSLTSSVGPAGPQALVLSVGYSF